jgi:bile acid:Na+ symporter, BASS family
VTIEQIVRVVALASIFLVMFGLGVRTSLAEAVQLFRRPLPLLRAMLAMNIVMPALVAVMVTALGVHPAVGVALIALAISPIPPAFSARGLKVVRPETTGYVSGLYVASAVLSFVLAPLTVEILNRAFGTDVHIGPAGIARIIALTVLLPLAAGLVVHRAWPSAAARGALISTIGTVILLLPFALIVWRSWPAMASLIGDGTILVIVAFTLLGQVIGHVLGGPTEDERTILSLATSARHPGVAVTIAGLTAQSLAPAAIVLALLVGVMASLPYMIWRKKKLDSAPPPSIHAPPAT